MNTAKTSLLPLFGLALLAATDLSLAAPISDTDQYAWAENAGWLNFKATNGDVGVYPDHLEGYVWAENIGWIRLGTHTSGGTHSYANNAADTYGVNRDTSTGALSGYAWSENAGWINFGATGGNAMLNASTGAFSGYVWGENIGWISLAGTATNDDTYAVSAVIHQVTPSAGSGGSVSPNTATGVLEGQTLSVTVTANGGYTRSNSVGGTCPAGSWSGAIWTTGAIANNCTISFSFTATGGGGGGGGTPTPAPIPDPTPAPTPDPTPVEPIPTDPTTWPPVSDWDELPDTDGDGLPNEIEAMAPGRSGPDGEVVEGDANGDGTPDWQQPHVASYPTVNDAGKPIWVTVSTSAEGQQVSIEQGTEINWPAELRFPTEPLLVKITGDTTGNRQSAASLAGDATGDAQARETPAGAIYPFSMLISQDETINGYWVRSQDGIWANLARGDQGGTTAAIDDQWRLEMEIQDGGPFDADGEVNGRIQSLGGPGNWPSQPQGRLYLNSGDSSLVLDGGFDELLDFGGADRYHLASALQAGVRLIDNQASRLHLPSGFAIDSARFFSDGLELENNGHTLRILGQPQGFRYLLGGDTPDDYIRSLSYAALASELGTEIPAPGAAANLATRLGRIGADGRLEETAAAWSARVVAPPVVQTADAEVLVLDAMADAQLRWSLSCEGSSPTDAAIYLTELASGVRWCYTDPAEQLDPTWRVDQPTLSADGRYLAYRVCLDYGHGQQDCWVDLHGAGERASLLWPLLEEVGLRLAFSPDGAELWWRVDASATPVLRLGNPLAEDVAE